MGHGATEGVASDVEDAHDQEATVPELPEIQAHAERLRASFVGVSLRAVVPLSFTALKTYAPPAEAAVGSPLEDVGRRGKHLLLRFPGVTYVVHLMQGGRLRVDVKQSRRPRGGVFRWQFADGRALLLTEAGTERRAGVWVVADDPHEAEPLADLGPEADAVDAETLAAAFADERRRVHTVLRDQRVLAGLGRRLANEVCHRARLSPFTPVGNLTSEDIDRLAAAIGDSIEEGLAFERAREDMSSSKERPGAVHRRSGQSCPVCSDVIRLVSYRDYEVDYCPTCQTDGRILADNTTSKFLK